ncbi:hypothetical protein SAY86_002883 [Trapa natans]|uniref:DUF569 domain-containing protein n=1 Tax=Trapa natans TaxID=22666 RepID=A0AAN7LKZ2_TRANT|nr:hypothetical protein SAY86_002883 [Trapa natans]
MEFFRKTYAVKLRSHHGKFLVADEEEQETVRQSGRSAELNNARWSVEPGKSEKTIRLKSCHGLYLSASDVPFFLGMTGKKVVLTRPGPDLDSDPTIEWEPIGDGFQVRLMAWSGKYLRANGGTPPWRNSITHDDHRGATQKWLLWEVEAVEPAAGDLVPDRDGSEPLHQYLLSVSSFSSVAEDIISVLGSEDSPKEDSSSYQLSDSGSVIEMFRNAKTVKLRSRHGKYLVAEDNGETVGQHSDGTCLNARWTVETIFNSESAIRLRSCHGQYLTASTSRFRLGFAGYKVSIIPTTCSFHYIYILLYQWKMTDGRCGVCAASLFQVLQTMPKGLDSSLEWEPIGEGTRVKLKARHGNFLRANSSTPPWSGSVTHDIPRRSSAQDWVLWSVQVMELRDQSVDEEPLVPVSPPALLTYSTPSSELDSNSSAPAKSPSFHRLETRMDRVASQNAKGEARVVNYQIANERGEVMGGDMQGYTLHFNGKNVEELTRKLEEETGIHSLAVCFRSPLNGELCPLRLKLPPTTVMHVVIVPLTVG